MKPSIKVKITSNRNKRKVFTPALAKHLGRTLVKALVNPNDAQSLVKAFLADLPKRFPRITGLQVHSFNDDTLLIQMDNFPKDAFEEKLVELADSWLSDPANETFQQAVQRRLEGEENPEARAYLHRAVLDFVKKNLRYQKRKREIVRRTLGSRLSIK